MERDDTLGAQRLLRDHLNRSDPLYDSN